MILIFNLLSLNEKAFDCIHENNRAKVRLIKEKFSKGLLIGICAQVPPYKIHHATSLSINNYLVAI